MGYALPAAIGAQMGIQNEEVWVVAGDGGFQMTMVELSTVVQERLPIKIIIINNGFLGMVRQWQDVFYNKRHAGTPLFNPDFVKIAEAYGIPGRALQIKMMFSAPCVKPRNMMGHSCWTSRLKSLPTSIRWSRRPKAMPT